MIAIDELIENNIRCCINCGYFIVVDKEKAKCMCRLTTFYDKPVMVKKMANRINNYSNKEKKSSGRLNCKFFI